MLADTMTGVQEQLRAAEERLRHAEERARIAEAKSAMLAANALKLETEASHKTSARRGRRACARRTRRPPMLLAQVVAEINALADAQAGADALARRRGQSYPASSARRILQVNAAQRFASRIFAAASLSKAMPLAVKSSSSSPDSVISVTMSQPPTNSPLT